MMRKALLALPAVAVAAVVAHSAAALVGISGSTQLGRIRAALCVGAVALLFTTFESIRRTHLKERYALLWIVPSFVILALAFFPGALDAVRRYFGMEYGSTIAGVAFLSLLCAVFCLSRTISRNENAIAACARRIALLQQRVAELEESRGGGKEDRA